MKALIIRSLFAIILFYTSPVIAISQDLRDKSGIKTGSVDEDGAIRDKSGIKTGSFDEHNNIRDKSGIKIGSADGVDKKKAAALFFFR